MSRKVPKEKIPHKWLSIIILDSVLYPYGKYHPQIFLEEFKYAEENKKLRIILIRNWNQNLIVIEIVIAIVILIMKNKFRKSKSDNNDNINKIFWTQ